MGLAPALVSNKTGMGHQDHQYALLQHPLPGNFPGGPEDPRLPGNDADCAAVGEYWAGSAKGFDPALVITLGTGIGSGMVRGGKLYIGHGAP